MYTLISDACISGAGIAVAALTVAGAAIRLWTVRASMRSRVTCISGAGIAVAALTVAGAAIRDPRVLALIVYARISSAGIAVVAIDVGLTSANQRC